MRSVLLLLGCLLLISCGEYTENVIREFDCSENYSSSFKEGIKEAKASILYSYKVRLSFGQEADRYLYDYSPKSYCKIKSCNEGYSMYSFPEHKNLISGYYSWIQLSYSSICIKTPTSCQEITSKSPTNSYYYGYMSFALNDLVNISQKNTPECATTPAPFSCDAGFSINDSDPQNPTCVASEASCLPGELAPGATSGIKTFDTVSDSYSSCQMTSCQAGYTLMGSTCMVNMPIPIMGCMDSRAANYNPAATQSDMSCVCGPLELPYNPINGCEAI